MKTIVNARVERVEREGSRVRLSAAGVVHDFDHVIFAIPPNVFGETALAIKETCMQDEEAGWSRLVVEKPFGRDLDSFEELNKTLSVFSEKMLYRIDHYLGVSNFCVG